MQDTIKKIREGDERTFAPDLTKPESWYKGRVHFTKDRGATITFCMDNNPMNPDFPTAPRSDVLEMLKPIKEMIIKAIELAHREFEPYFLEPKELHPTIKEIYRLATLLSEHEKTPRMKDFWLEIRDLACLGLFEDVAYLGRLQWTVEQADMDKFKPSKEDTYWFKTRVDFDHGPT